LAPKLITNYS